MKILQTQEIRRQSEDVEALRYMVENQMTTVDGREIIDDYRAAAQELEALRAVTPIEVERDHMPRQVAREMLCAPGLSNRMRKNCFDALATHYVSQLKSKPGETKLANRFKRSSLTQLEKWISRVIFRRAKTQKEYLKAMKMGETPMKRALIAALDYKAQLLDLTRDCLENELMTRQEKAAKN